MKELRKLFVAVSLFALQCGITASAYDSEVDGIYYNLDNTALTASVVSGDDAYSGDVTIPSSVTIDDQTYSVTSIANNAFKECTGLTSIDIPNTVTSIGYASFYKCNGLTSVTIPNSVTTISEWAFASCSSLTMVTLPSALTSLGDYSFRYSSALTTIITDNPTPVNVPSADTFTNRANIALYVPQGAKDAYSNANYWSEFNKIVALAGPADNIITFADSNVKTICVTNWDLDGDGEISYYEAAKIEDLNAKFNSQTTITSFDELQYFTGLTSIRGSSFSGCTGLASISIPANVTIIGQAAFKNCTNLENLTICDGTTNLTLTYQQLYQSSSKPGQSLFNDCPLKTLYIGRDLQYQDTNELGSTSLLYSFRNSTIRSITFGRVMATANLGFATNNVSTLLIPGNIKTYNCTGLIKLTSVTIENGVESIGDYAFANCTGLTAVTIPGSVNDIGIQAFQDCRALTSLSIPASVTTIGLAAFDGCTGVRTLTIEDGDNTLTLAKTNTKNNIYKPFIDSDVLTEVYIGRNLEYDATSYQAGGVYYPYSPFYGQNSIKKVTLGSQVTSLYKNLFRNCDGLQAINIPGNVIEVGDYAFAECDRLSDIKLPSSIKSPNTHIQLGNCAFSACTRLAALSIPATVEFTGSSVFLGCTRLGSLKIAEGISAIGESAFQDCTSMTSLTLPNTLETIGDDAFSGCSGLISFAMPNNLDSIGSNAFYNCTGLTSVNIPKARVIGTYAFSGCSGLQNVVLGDGVRTVKSYAFQECTGLETLIIGRNIKDFCVKQSSSNLPERYDQFKNCKGLKTVYCYATEIPTAYYSYTSGTIFSYTAFSGHTNATLYVPSSALSNYKKANNWKDFKNIYALSGGDVSTTVNLNDDNTYDGERTAELTTLSYTRNFNNTKWQALYVPFAMQYNDWKDNFNIAFINDVHQEEGEGPYVEARHLKAGDRTEANTPYLIQAKSAGEKTLTPTEKTLYPAEENSFELTSWNEIFTITGTYTGVSGTEMFNNGYYAMGGGTLHKTNSTANGLAPYRWYMTINDRSGNPVDLGNEVKIIMIDEFGVETDEIISINNDNRTSSDDRCYDISGRPVSHPTKGLYIRNGKKILVGPASR